MPGQVISDNFKKFISVEVKNILLSMVLSIRLYCLPHLDGVEMGDIFLIKEDFKVPRNVRKLGKIVEFVKGRDGNTRGAKLHTVSSSGLQQNCYRTVQ